MLKDLIISKNEAQNLSPEDCKKWWTQKMVEPYFTAYSWGLSQPQLYAKIPLTKTSKILEIGAGYGRQLSEFVKISDNVYGIDIAIEAVNLIKKHVPQAIASEYDGENIPYTDNCFDFVTSIFVLQHVSKTIAENLLKESYRVLKSEGIFLHEFLGGNYIAGENNEHYSRGEKDMMYNNGYTLQEIKDLCVKLNMTILFIEEFVMTTDNTTNIWLAVKK